MSREALINMSKLSRDGGFAFPTSIDSCIGMSQRDYFAATVLGGIIGNFHHFPSTPMQAANYAYEYADAMLEARKEGGDE